MIKVENIKVFNFEGAIRGMRNPMNSWDKSDSDFDFKAPDGTPCVGQNDLELMQKLYKAGTEHRKYARQIYISMDIYAPLYWWKEFDTYKVGTTANSCSTMHKIHTKEFELNDFSWEHLGNSALEGLEYIINILNNRRDLYNNTKDKKYWYEMIQLLPSSYEQKRTITMNYENAFNIIKQRTGHKLDEWNEFVEVLKELPYIKDITERS